MNKTVALILSLAVLAFFVLPTAADATAFTWRGFYIGGTAGAGFGGDSSSVDLDGFNYLVDNPIPGEVTKVGAESAFIGGVEIGYNHTVNRMVLGIEADLSGFNFRAAEIPNSSRTDWGSDTRVSVEMNWLSTVRGRLGIAMDRWLIYGTGGVAFSDGEYRNHDFCNTVPPCGGGLIDAQGDMGTGWTTGRPRRSTYLYVSTGRSIPEQPITPHRVRQSTTDFPRAQRTSTSSASDSTTSSVDNTRRHRARLS
jgi:opacity protein-like surface antigen